MRQQHPRRAVERNALPMMGIGCHQRTRLERAHGEPFDEIAADDEAIDERDSNAFARQMAGGVGMADGDRDAIRQPYPAESLLEAVAGAHAIRTVADQPGAIEITAR